MPIKVLDKKGIREYINLRKRGLTRFAASKRMGKSYLTLCRWETYFKSGKVRIKGFRPPKNWVEFK